MFGYEKDNPSYEFLKTKIFCERSSSARSEETVYTQNLAQAKQFFADLLSDLSTIEIEVLYKKITQQLLFNLFTITEDVDVCVAFETMNNRGKPLSYLELLKNRLIYLSLKFNAPDYERKKLRTAINDCWKSIYHNLGRNKENPLDDDQFLLTHYLTYFGQDLVDETIDNPTIFRKLYRLDYASDLLQNRFVSRNVTSDAPKDKSITLPDVYKYVSSLQETVEIWYKMWNPLDSDYSKEIKIWLDKINRIGLQIYHPLILVFLQLEQSDSNRLLFLKAIERKLFMISLVKGRYGLPYPLETNVDGLQLAISLRTGKTTSAKITKHISEESTGMIKNSETIRQIIAQFGSSGFYGWDGIRYFLFEYNLDLQQKSKSDRPKIFWPEFSEPKNDFVSVEHIYPRQARNEYWTSRFKGLTQKQKESLRDSLGNLLPLSKPKNSSLSNKPFPDKIDGKQELSIGYRYGCFAENEVAKETEWTPDSILQRGIRMLSFMEQRWNIEFGDINQKKRMLGLDFMK